MQQDPRDLVEIFTGRMPFLFDAMLKEPALTHLLNHLLLQPQVSRHLAPILLQHLIDERLPDLQKPDSKVPTNCALRVENLGTGRPESSPIGCFFTM